MTSFTCALAWLCAVLVVPLMLFVWALDTKNTKLTGIENMGGAGRKSHLCIGFVLVLSGVGLYLNKCLYKRKGFVTFA